jgi:hypothetical protein
MRHFKYALLFVAFSSCSIFSTAMKIEDAIEAVLDADDEPCDVMFSESHTF